MVYHYIIIEDCLPQVESLQISMQKHQDFCFKGHAQNIESALQLCLHEKPHLIFLDVELGNEKGFELIEKLREFYNTLPLIIMTTGHDHYAKQALNNDVLYFLSKPIASLELQKALHKFICHFADRKNHLVLKDKTYGHLIVPFDDFLFAECEGANIHIMVRPHKRHTVNKSMKELEIQLPKPFIRIHKSYLINSKYIERVNVATRKLTISSPSGVIEFKDGKDYNIDSRLKYKENSFELPIGDSFIDKLKNELHIHKGL